MSKPAWISIHPYDPINVLLNEEDKRILNKYFVRWYNIQFFFRGTIHHGWGFTFEDYSITGDNK